MFAVVSAVKSTPTTPLVSRMHWNGTQLFVTVYSPDDVHAVAVAVPEYCEASHARVTAKPARVKVDSVKPVTPVMPDVARVQVIAVQPPLVV